MKKLALMILIFGISLSGVSISAEPDCTDPKGFHQKLMCKTMKKDKDNSTENTAKTYPSTKTVVGKGKNILKKIKNPFKKFNDWSKKQKKTIF